MQAKIETPDSMNQWLLTTEQLIVGESGSGTYVFYERDRICGEIDISIDFFPNHQSLKRLIEDARRDQGQPHFILTQIAFYGLSHVSPRTTQYLMGR